MCIGRSVRVNITVFSFYYSLSPPHPVFVACNNPVFLPFNALLLPFLYTTKEASCCWWWLGTNSLHLQVNFFATRIWHLVTNHLNEICQIYRCSNIGVIFLCKKKNRLNVAHLLGEKSYQKFKKRLIPQTACINACFTGTNFCMIPARFAVANMPWNVQLAALMSCYLYSWHPRKNKNREWN